jgi:Ca2+/H+ antiporter, TMEM165/GDT1 family
MTTWAQLAPAALSAFLASLVECIEALTIILAVGAVRGWRAALTGAAGALIALVVLVAVLGPVLTGIPLAPIRIVVGALTLAFGLRWLRKAVRRAAGTMRLRDESAAYARETARLRDRAVVRGGSDREAMRTTFQVTLMEGVEVVFIVLAVGAARPGLLGAASGGALAALLLVAAAGLALHRPIASVPENTLKYAVAVMLCGFGTFWLGEGLGVAWPGGDASMLALVGVFLMASLVAVRVMRPRAAA